MPTQVHTPAILPSNTEIRKKDLQQLDSSKQNEEEKVVRVQRKQNGRDSTGGVGEEHVSDVHQGPGGTQFMGSSETPLKWPSPLNQV